MVAGGVGLAPFATLAEALAATRHADHALLRRALGRSSSTSISSSALGVTLVLATEDGSARRARARDRAARARAAVAARRGAAS